MTDTTEPGHNINVNGHDIFGYSRYVDLYNNVVANAMDGFTAVEVGSFLGQSTAAMAYFIQQSGKRIDFYAVDLFEISEFSDEPHAKVIERHGGDFYAAFIDNLTKAGVVNYVTPKKMSSKEAAATFEDRSIDFLMIDASHKYNDVVADIKAWWPKMKLGGIISGDDVDWPEVALAANDTLGKYTLHGNSTWLTRKVALDLPTQRQLMSNRQ